MRLTGSLGLAVLFFVVAVGIAAVQRSSFSAEADQSNDVVTAGLAESSFTTMSHGRSLAYNLLVASGLSVVTAYFFLRRHQQEQNKS